MTSRAAWQIDKHVILITFMGTVPIEEAAKTVSEFVLPNLNQLPHPIHLIVDFSHVEKLDFSIRQALEHQVAREFFFHDHLGWTVFLLDDDDYFTYLLVTSLKRYLNDNVHVAESVEDAISFLHEQDEHV